jgi:hypothetical protein
VAAKGEEGARKRQQGPVLRIGLDQPLPTARPRTNTSSSGPLLGSSPSDLLSAVLSAGNERRRVWHVEAELPATNREKPGRLRRPREARRLAAPISPRPPAGLPASLCKLPPAEGSFHRPKYPYIAGMQAPTGRRYRYLRRCKLPPAEGSSHRHRYAYIAGAQAPTGRRYRYLRRCKLPPVEGSSHRLRYAYTARMQGMMTSLREDALTPLAETSR